MEQGYVEKGFIVDVSHAHKPYEIIYELSSILDLPDIKDKKIALKLGNIVLSKNHLLSIKAMVESMGSVLGSVCTSSMITSAAAKELEIEVAEIENTVPAVDFEVKAKPEASKDLEVALDRIFGDDVSDISNLHKDINEPKEDLKPEEKFVQANEDFSEEADHDEFNKAIEQANSVEYQVNEDIKPQIDILEEIRNKHRETEQLPTLYIQRTLRSGQSIKSEGNIIVIGDANPGSEIIATGDITVWGILGGIATAGSDGNKHAVIRALKMNPIQLRIADVFARRPDAANISSYVQKEEAYVPEEAFIKDRRIFIQKIHEDNAKI